MKRFFMFFAVAALVLTLSACGDEGLCVGPECLGATGGTDEYVAGQGYTIPFTHLNGEGHETDNYAYLLMQFDVGEYVIYQMTYLSCTCRSAAVNFWNTVYVQVNKDDGTLRTISFRHDVDADGVEGHYNGGNWGDSSGDPNQGGITLEDLEAGYFPWYIGKSLADLDGLKVVSNTSMHGISNTSSTQFPEDLVDGFADSTVSTNNFLRAIIELLRYHENNY